MKATTNWANWGPLRDRYQERRPRRLLALEGGGIRGILTLQVLKRLERLLALHYYPDSAEQQAGFRLCHFFDYVGGTSTGSIIAAGLARGMSVAEIEAFYVMFGKEAFTRRSIFLRWRSLYEDGPLARKLQEVFCSQGELETLEPRFLKTLLLIVTKNVTTDSHWPISSNPDASYNDPGRADCNLRLPLWQIVRASTAAPVFFPPEVVHLGDQAFVFVDGGTTPFNDPGFLMVRMATVPEYRLGWATGERQLLLVSAGTGWAPVKGSESDDPESNLLFAVKNTLSALMRQAQVDQDTNCRTIGRCSYGHALDKEVGDLIPRHAAGEPTPLSQNLGRAFLYCRYDAELTRQGLAELGVSGIDPDEIGGMDNVKAMPALTTIGHALGERVDLAHLGRFIDVPLSIIP